MRPRRWPLGFVPCERKLNGGCGNAAGGEKWSWPISRVLLPTPPNRNDGRRAACSHSSRVFVTKDLERPTRIRRGQHHGIPIWPCSGRGLPSHPCYHARGALLPHRFTLTAALPVARHYSGGLLSAALSVSSRFPGVTWRPVLWSPDFPLAARGASPTASGCMASSNQSVRPAPEFVNHQCRPSVPNPTRRHTDGNGATHHARKRIGLRPVVESTPCEPENWCAGTPTNKEQQCREFGKEFACGASLSAR